MTSPFDVTAISVIGGTLPRPLRPETVRRIAGGMARIQQGHARIQVAAAAALKTVAGE